MNTVTISHLFQCTVLAAVQSYYTNINVIIIISFRPLLFSQNVILTHLQINFCSAANNVQFYPLHHLQTLCATDVAVVI